MDKTRGTDLVLLATAISAKLCECYEKKELFEIRTLLGLIIQNLNAMLNC